MLARTTNESKTPMPAGPPQVRRWVEQRWLIDNIIRANGPEWDQPRFGGLLTAIGPEAALDLAALRARITKWADIAPSFEAVARRREAKARAAAESEDWVTARENYFMAANYWATAQWPIDETNSINIAYNARKRSCFEQYASHADHRIEAVWIPFQGKALPAWFHLPPGYSDGRLPAVVSIPGMDGFKERSVALYGDSWLNRAIAVLVVEGPGQYESALHGIHVSVPAWAATGTAVVEWLLGRDEIDPQCIGITGRSFGSFFATIALAHEPRFCAGAIHAPCLEPGCHTIFEEASPTFKKRFMYMAGYTDESEFDAFARTLTWEGHAENISVPFLCIAGEADELSPLSNVERFIDTICGPKRLVIYENARHTVAGVSATHLGPSPPSVMTSWMVARLSGKQFATERWFVSSAGDVTATPIGKRR